MKARKNMVSPDGPDEDPYDGGPHVETLDDEVVETDYVPGGWDLWDVTAPPPRKRRDAPAPPPDDQAPGRMFSRAAAHVLIEWRVRRGLRRVDLVVDGPEERSARPEVSSVEVDERRIPEALRRPLSSRPPSEHHETDPSPDRRPPGPIS